MPSNKNVHCYVENSSKNADFITKAASDSSKNRVEREPCMHFITRMRESRYLVESWEVFDAVKLGSERHIWAKFETWDIACPLPKFGYSTVLHAPVSKLSLAGWNSQKTAQMHRAFIMTILKGENVWLWTNSRTFLQ